MADLAPEIRALFAKELQSINATFVSPCKVACFVTFNLDRSDFNMPNIFIRLSQLQITYKNISGPGRHTVD